jgi:hypothetical protein
MPLDLCSFRDDLTAGHAAARWVKPRRKLGPYLRKILALLRKPDAAPLEVICRLLGVRASAAHSEETIALGRVLIELAVEVSHDVLHADQVGRAYETYFREDYPFDLEIPATRGEALVLALLRGERALAAFVAREAARFLERPEPDRRLTRQVQRHLQLFELIAYETFRLQRGHGDELPRRAPQGVGVW